MLSDTDLSNVLQKLGVGAEQLAGESPSRVLCISQFQAKAARILKYLEELSTNDKETTETSENSPATSNETDTQSCCVKCLKFASESELVTCSLPCKARFHSDGCGGKVITTANNQKLKCCLPCTGIIVLCSLIPEILTEDNRRLMDKVRSLLGGEQSPTKLGYTPAVPSALSLGGLLKPGFGFGANVNANANENSFKQLNQLQMLSHQLSGTFPTFINPSANFALAFQQQFENTQNIFQLWGSLGGSQATSQGKRKGEELKAAPSSSRHKANPKSSGTNAGVKSNETKARGDAKRSGLNDKQKSKQRRTRWLSTELETLWKGILLHGNRWYEVKNNLPGRTYYQVKDKGRRLLYMHGWKTGRLKNDNNGAYEDAKAIAREMLARQDGKQESKATVTATEATTATATATAT